MKTLPDAKLLSNFEWFGNEKSTKIDAANITKIITEVDLDPSVEAITFATRVTGRLQIGLSLVSLCILEQLSFTWVPWLIGVNTGMIWKIRPAYLKSLGRRLGAIIIAKILEREGVTTYSNSLYSLICVFQHTLRRAEFWSYAVFRCS